MPGECPICVHPERSVIEQAMTTGVMPDESIRASTRKIASHWGLSSHMRVQDHKAHILGEPAPIVVKVPEVPPKTVAKAHAAALATVAPVPDRPGADADPLDQCRWLITVTQGILDRLDQPGQEALALKAIKELRGQFTLVASLLGRLKERVELSGPGGGPVPIAAVVATLPAPVQQLHLQVEQGDAHAALLLDRYARTGEETLEGQIRWARAFVVELEAEAGIR